MIRGDVSSHVAHDTHHVSSFLFIESRIEGQKHGQPARRRQASKAQKLKSNDRGSLANPPHLRSLFTFTL